MQNKEIKKSRNEQIAELLASGERIKDFYRFTAQNPHIDLHDACQIALARPKASMSAVMLPSILSPLKRERIGRSLSCSSFSAC